MDAGDIAARTVEASNKTILDRVATYAEDNGNGCCRGLGRNCRWGATGCGDDCHLTADEIGCQFPQSVIRNGPTEFNRDILIFDKTGFVQALTKRSDNPRTRLWRTREKISDNRYRWLHNRHLLLAARRQRPSGCRTNRHFDEIASSHCLFHKASDCADLQ